MPLCEDDGREGDGFAVVVGFSWGQRGQDYDDAGLVVVGCEEDVCDL